MFYSGFSIDLQNVVSLTLDFTSYITNSKGIQFSFTYN